MTIVLEPPAFTTLVLVNAVECPTIEVWRRNTAAIEDRDSPDFVGFEKVHKAVVSGAREAELEALADALEPMMHHRRYEA
jgi:hypothetical protein